MMHRFQFILILFYLFFCSTSQAQQYNYDVDLINVTNDRVKVICDVPEIKSEKVDFIFPNLVPGSYAYKEYGRYVEDFKAFDKDGKKLKIKKADRYNYTILHADQLRRIEYYVNDSWEELNGKKFIFQPGGTNIEKGKNFVLNNYGFIGYIDGLKNAPFELLIHKPKTLKGYSYLDILNKDNQSDVVKANTYDELVDNPIMYCPPNESTFKVGSTDINICVYSENKKVSVDQVAKTLKPICHSLQHFFGELPVKKYLFIFYFVDADNLKPVKGSGLSFGFGALEHNHCSFYYVPESENYEEIKNFIDQMCSHEFLHILTPLNIHSKEIEDFNFRKPNMSKHLWMYEGMTEYFSFLTQLQDSLITEKEFIKEMRKKTFESQEYGNFSMTEMSKNVCEPKYQKKYLSVYNRGAVLAMLLDILIIDRSNGKQTLKDVMMKLREKYGPSKPFTDDSLFTEITRMTHPDIGDFFDRYIIGEQHPDYKSILHLAGYGFDEISQKQVYYFGRFGLGYKNGNDLAFVGVEENRLGIKENDLLISIDGDTITNTNFADYFDKYFADNEDGEEIKVVVKRGGLNQTLTATPRKVYRTALNNIYLLPEPTPKETECRNVFLGKY